MGSLLVGQSGGPTAVINSTLTGVFKEALKHETITNIYGALHGIKGILNETFIKIDHHSNLEHWETTPGAILGSIRFRIKNYPEDQEIYEKLLHIFQKYDIRYFFYIGGNDSMDTCFKISQFFKNVNYQCSVIGLPKTIDNDLVATDHTPGYGSACKIVAATISEIYHDTNVYEKGRVSIVEIMGRDAGWLTASTHLANINHNGPDFIYLPEVPFDINQFLSDVKARYELNHKVLIAVSEGIKDQAGNYIVNYQHDSEDDSFGHIQLGGVAGRLSDIVAKELHLPVRAIELNLPQRCAAHLASLTDVKEAYKCGSFGVKQALKNKTGMMVTLQRIIPYQIKYALEPLDKVANHVKPFPNNWIINNNQISDEYLNYALPLIKGESKPKFKDGLPIYAQIK